MNEKIKSGILNILFAVVCTAVIISLAVSITVWCRPIYYFDLGYLGIPERSGIAEEICRLNYDALIDYNVIGGPDELQFPTLAMSETGRIHFEEVKDIFITMQWTGIIGGALIILAMFKWKENKWLHYTVFTTVGIAAAVLAAVIIDWQWAFTTMHKIFFNNDYWIFSAKTDPVIKILPDEFFMHCGLVIILLVVLAMAAFEIIYRKRRKHNG